MTAESRKSAKPDLIDRIANELPVEVRSDYYRELRHCRSLPENDEMLRILRAMQFLTLLMVQVPNRVAAEREKLERLFKTAIDKIQEITRSSQTYQKQLDDRLIRLPGKIAYGINPTTIASEINESLRQQFIHTTIPETAQALSQTADEMKETTAKFSRAAGALTNSYRSTVEQARQAIDKIESSISRASKAAKKAAEDLSRFISGEYRKSLLTVIFIGFVMVFFLGMLHQKFKETPKQPAIEIAPITESADKPAPNPKIKP